MVLNSLLEDRKLPLTITREMTEADPFFNKGNQEAKKEDILNLYKKTPFITKRNSRRFGSFRRIR
jgi:hypothetical protein